MVEAPVPPPPPAPATVPRRRLFWFIMVISWLVLAAWGVRAYRQNPTPRWPQVTLLPRGTHHTIQETTGPLTLRLDDGKEVRLAGVADPADAAAAERVAARLRELAPPGTLVYVEIEPRLAGDASPPPAASVFLPPPGSRDEQPFPYDQSRLLGAVLIQEGWAHVKSDELYRYLNEFINLEDDAQRNRRGLWAAN